MTEPVAASESVVVEPSTTTTPSVETTTQTSVETTTQTSVETTIQTSVVETKLEVESFTVRSSDGTRAGQKFPKCKACKKVFEKTENEYVISAKERLCMECDVCVHAECCNTCSDCGNVVCFTCDPDKYQCKTCNKVLCDYCYTDGLCKCEDCAPDGEEGDEHTENDATTETTVTTDVTAANEANTPPPPSEPPLKKVCVETHA